MAALVLLGVEGHTSGVPATFFIGASAAPAVEDQIVPFEQKACRHNCVQQLEAAWYFKDPPTIVAIEVMVVRLAGHFVAWRLAG